MNTWEQWEAKTQSLLATQQWDACIHHINGISDKERKDKKYIRSIERVYKKMLAVPTYQTNVNILRHISHMYCTEYLENRATPVLHCDKQYCKTQAAHYFSLLLQQERRPYDIYRYAQLLYCCSHDFVTTEPFVVKHRMKEKAYELYEETLQLIEIEKTDMHTALYRQACYALSRCGLELVSSYSILLQEMALVADMPLPFLGNKEKYRKKLQRIHACLDTLRAMERLPRQAKRIADIQQIRKTYGKAEQIYYLLGKAFDYTWQFGLCDNKMLAKQLAERYYTYACEINYHNMENKKGKSLFFHMYMALVNIYIRQKDKEKCKKIWQHYKLSRYIPQGYQTLTAIRWAIVEKNYEKARYIITAYQNKKDWQQGLSPQRATVCRNILDALQGTLKTEENHQFSASQLKLLLKLTKHCQTAL